jgi:hypothetical protein
VVDVEDLDLLVETPAVDEIALRAALGVDGHLVAGLEIDLAGLEIDDVLGDVGPMRSSSVARIALRPFSASCLAWRAVILLAGLDHHFAGVGVDQVDDGLHALHALGAKGTRHAALARV